MVGDTSFDVEMARSAEVAALGVSWGYHPARELVQAGAHLVIDDYAALEPAVDRLLAEAEVR
jgi:phosphoglycolate phosphatase